MVNSYGHGGTVSSPNHNFFLDKLEQAVNQYFVHILSLVTDNNLELLLIGHLVYRYIGRKYRDILKY